MSQARRRHRRRQPRAHRSGSVASGVAMLAVGLIAGSALTALYLGVRGESPADIGSGLKNLVEASRSTPRPSAAEPAASVPAPRPATQFDFYTVLPEIEAVLPTEGARAEPEPPRPTKAQEGVFFMLQAGSYASYADADRLKARLALAGLEAHIQKVTIQSRGDFYRVRLGPFIDLNKLAAVDKRLAEQGISAIRLRITRESPG